MEAAIIGHVAMGGDQHGIAFGLLNEMSGKGPRDV